jgi:hypothetical protein
MHLFRGRCSCTLGAQALPCSCSECSCGALVASGELLPLPPVVHVFSAEAPYSLPLATLFVCYTGQHEVLCWGQLVSAWSVYNSARIVHVAPSFGTNGAIWLFHERSLSLSLTHFYSMEFCNHALGRIQYEGGEVVGVTNTPDQVPIVNIDARIKVSKSNTFRLH